MNTINQVSLQDTESIKFPVEETDRRNTLKVLLRATGKLALSTIPVGLGAFFK